MNDTLFKVLTFTPRETNTLRGFLDVSLPSGLLIRGLSLHERDGARWLGMPSQKFVDKNGDEGISRIIEFVDRAACERFRDAVLAALDEYQIRGRG